MTSGSRSIASSNARAGASGVLRCCSQSRKVVMGRWTLGGCRLSKFGLCLNMTNGRSLMWTGRKPQTVEAGQGPQRLDRSRFAPANRRRLSPRLCGPSSSIADLWGLTEAQRLLVLGYPSRSTYHNWCKHAREHGAFTLDFDVLTRISAVFGIHQALGILFPRASRRRVATDPHNDRLWRTTTARSRDQWLSGWAAHGATFPRRRARRSLHAAERRLTGVHALRRAEIVFR